MVFSTAGLGFGSGTDGGVVLVLGGGMEDFCGGVVAVGLG